MSNHRNNFFFLKLKIQKLYLRDQKNFSDRKFTEGNVKLKLNWANTAHERQILLMNSLLKP